FDAEGRWLYAAAGRPAQRPARCSSVTPVVQRRQIAQQGDFSQRGAQPSRGLGPLQGCGLQRQRLRSIELAAAGKVREHTRSQIEGAADIQRRTVRGIERIDARRFRKVIEALVIKARRQPRDLGCGSYSLRQALRLDAAVELA